MGFDSRTGHGGRGGGDRQKKPAHEERVNPSFERVEETGRTIATARRWRKLLFPIVNITAVNNSCRDCAAGPGPDGHALYWPHRSMQAPPVRVATITMTPSEPIRMMPPCRARILALPWPCPGNRRPRPHQERRANGSQLKHLLNGYHRHVSQDELARRCPGWQAPAGCRSPWLPAPNGRCCAMPSVAVARPAALQSAGRHARCACPAAD